MTNRQLNKKFQSLRALRASGEPNALWVAQTRALLLEHARPVVAPAVLPIRLPRVGFFPKFMFALRPVMALFMVAGFGAFGWMASTNAFAGSMPGDRLYGLKTVTERAQLTFAIDETSRTMLQLEFLGRRANEVAVAAESNDPERTAALDATVEKLAREIETVSGTLDAAQKNSSAENVTVVAKAVDRTISGVHAVLGKTKNLLSVNAQKRVSDVAQLADDVSLRAVAVLVSLAPATANSEDVASRVQEKIDSAEQKLTAAVTEGNEDAKKALDEAKKALTAKNYSEAVTKVQESNALSAETVPAVTVETVTNVNTNTPTNTNTKIKAIEQ